MLLIDSRQYSKENHFESENSFKIDEKILLGQDIRGRISTWRLEEDQQGFGRTGKVFWQKLF